MGKIYLINDSVEYKLTKRKRLDEICKKILSDYGFILENLNIVLVTDNRLNEINREFLKKDTLTDVIGFNYANKQNEIDGELYISLDRIKENAEIYSKETDNELFRVIIHGVLHFMGKEDNTPYKKKKMSELEDFYLKLCFT